MRGSALGLALVFTASLFTLAGCTGAPAAALANDVTKVPLGAPSEVGSGSFVLTIHVASERANGTAIPHAGVLIYLIDKPLSPPSAQELRRKNATFVARTNDKGEVLAHLEPRRTYSFFAGTDNYTLEGRHLVKMLAERPGITIILYKTELDFEVAGTLQTDPTAWGKTGPAGVSFSTYGPPRFYGKAIHFTGDAALDKQYAFRLVGADATLTWQNTGLDYADLGIRLAFNAATYFDQDKVQESASAPGKETISVPPEYLRFAAGKSDAVPMVGPFSRFFVVAPDGIPWKVQVHVEFSSDGPAAKQCIYYVAPGPQYCPMYYTFASGVTTAAFLGGLSVALGLNGRRLRSAESGAAKRK